MGPNNTPEQQQNKESDQAVLAAQAVQEIMSKLRAIDASEATPQEKAQQKSEVAASVLNDYQQAQKNLENLREAAKSSEVSEQQKNDIKKEQQGLRQALIKASTLEDNDVHVAENVKAQRVLRELSKVPPTDSEAVAIQNALGDYLLGEGAKDIIISKPGETKSNFMQDLDNLASENPTAADKIKYAVGSRATDFGLTPEEMLKIFRPTQQESQNASNPEGSLTPEQQQQLMEEMGQSRDRRFGPDGGYYETRFTDVQKDLIATFYDPEKFVDYLEAMNEGTFLKGGREEAIRVKQKMAEDIKEYYEKNNKNFEPGDSLEKQVEKHWGEKVSEAFDWKVSDVINQLFLELQQKSPNKFYEQIMQEDIFQGPAMIQKRIQAAINSLMTKIGQIEGGDDKLAKRIDKLHLYEQSVSDPYIQERGKEGEDKKIYPRLHPLTHGERIGLTDFIKHVYVTIDHTIEKAEYFHNSRAIYGHPPGKEGFYHQLGEFAEHIKGVGIDEILLLPDGQYVMQAYQLYDKMLQEDFAQLDHRHRPDQLSNKLERVNSNIELQVIKQLKDFYPDLTAERVNNIVNSAVGISRGIFLTESEMSAYADPLDSEGKGMIASYSTNDAGSLNVFNPMHTILRWQGEHNINLMYFMSVDGQPGEMWDHQKALKNAAKYHDALSVGRGRGIIGKGGLPKETFADSMMNIGKVGGPGERKGWRMKHPLDGHYVFEKKIDAQRKEYSTNVLDPLKTFKAMEAIGYEAIYDFVMAQMPGRTGDLLKTTKGSLADQRNELFKYMYKRYFSKNPDNFQESEFNQYIDSLKIKGEENALKEVKKGSNNNWEEQTQLETSKLFMNNFIAHYVAERFPTKFMRIDKNRLNEKGVSRWTKIWNEFKGKGWERGHFDEVMKDINVAEMLLRRQISEKIRNNMKFDKDWTLDKIDDIKNLPYRLDESKIRELLSENASEDKNRKNKTFKSEKEIKDAVELFQYIKKDLDKGGFLDSEAYEKIKEFKFTFGLEDTDISLMSFRATGPRMVARAIKDVSSVEENLTKWILQMPQILNEIAINGKHDFSEIITYMRKAQKAITDIGGVPDTYEYMYKMAGTIINYFKKDGMAKPLFGLFRLGKKNSIAAEYAGRSTAVWEWDSRDIDRFAVAMESYGLLKNNPYDLQKFDNGEFKGGKPENIWIINPITKKPFKTPFKKRHVDYEYNALRLRKEHGADWKAISWDMLNQFLPLAIAFLLWKYIKDAMDEAGGKKKQ
ncbi:MAG: hypothetical protein AAB441_04540 [Patescibacteria group bacterium]